MRLVRLTILVLKLFFVMTVMMKVKESLESLMHQKKKKTKTKTKRKLLFLQNFWEKLDPFRCIKHLQL